MIAWRRAASLISTAPGRFPQRCCGLSMNAFSQVSCSSYTQLHRVAVEELFWNRAFYGARSAPAGRLRNTFRRDAASRAIAEASAEICGPALISS